MRGPDAEQVAPRGIRNGNPGNIRKGEDWKGLADLQTDPAFCVFISPVYGIRALAKIILTYRRKHGLRSVGAIISCWVPPNENDTPVYVAHVCQLVGAMADQELSIETSHVLRRLVRAIILHENGQCPYGIEIDEGVEMALEGR